MDVSLPSRGCVTCSIRGYSLTELLVAVAIGATLLSLAVPSFSTIIANTQLTTQVNEFAAYLNYARSEAIKTGSRVEVCKSRDGSSCDNTAAWHDGWIVFVDEDTNRLRGSSERLLRRGTMTATTLALDYNAFPTDNYVVYYPSGMSMSNGTFVFCDEHNRSEAHALVLYKTGRLRASDTMPDGSMLSCP